ncbi:uncharacterized protein LOC141777033 isoform X1 [Sebastes fasciatus]|uniref:uncharacterized protein LOC141777033 isoform X1 n=1 Tax=Sebastes fasciatus TaxID=394691 RepID=UPI003D9F9CD2
MRFSLVLAALLCFTTWMSVGHAPIVPVASCCLGWSNLKGVPLNRILDYTIQSDGVCPIKAVVFQTTRGLGISSDPNSDRAEKAILKVDEEKEKALQEKGQNEEGLTSDITPTVSTTAVAFQTKPGVRIRSDPNSEEKAILKVDEEKKEVFQEKGWNEEGLTSDITPTVSTTAVAFQTTRGLGISSDPNSDRAEKAILKVDEEKEKALQEKGQNEEGLTSDITPTVSTTAVAFQTTRGVGISSDPNSDRAKEAILKVDEEKKKALQEKGQIEDGSTSDITPAVCTKPKKNTTEERQTWKETPEEEVQEREEGVKKTSMRNHKTNQSYHSQQTLLFPFGLILLYYTNSEQT